jgi:hypothetical protein
MIAAEATLQQQRQGKLPQLDGARDSESCGTIQTAEELAQIEADERDVEAMSQAVVFGRAGDPLPSELREMFNVRRRILENRGLEEPGYVNSSEDWLWPTEDGEVRNTPDVAAEDAGEDWVDAREVQARSGET